MAKGGEGAANNDTRNIKRKGQGFTVEMRPASGRKLADPSFKRSGAFTPGTANNRRVNQAVKSG